VIKTVASNLHVCVTITRDGRIDITDLGNAFDFVLILPTLRNIHNLTDISRNGNGTSEIYWKASELHEVNLTFSRGTVCGSEFEV